MLRVLWERFRNGSSSETSLGRRGEALAARHLKRLGYRIVERNYSIGKDEADIIALTPDGHMVVVVEVKTRRDDRAIPEEHISRAKVHHLSRLAGHLLKERRFRDRALRFDVVAIVWRIGEEPIVRHHESAFDSVM